MQSHWLHWAEGSLYSRLAPLGLRALYAVALAPLG
jgi:hypothetical protein